jgi:hypothetical protein
MYIHTPAKDGPALRQTPRRSTPPSRGDNKKEEGQRIDSLAFVVAVALGIAKSNRDGYRSLNRTELDEGERMTAKVEFTEAQRWVGSHDVVEFGALAGQQRIRCAISLEALCDNFDGDDKEPLKCFEENRARIQSIAAKLIAQKRFERDGRILIRSSDR